MTVRESSICSVVQSFPILLILAQKYSKCLKTPLIYEPPKATPSPEYYEALDALFQNLFGHGYPGHGHGFSGCAYDHGIYGHGAYGHGAYGHGAYGHGAYGHGAYGHGTYGHGTYGYGKKLNHNYAVASPCYTHSASPHSYNIHTYPTTIHSGYPNYGLKKISVYDLSGSGINGYKGTYAPTQVYSQNHKYRVVIKKNKKRRPHKLQIVGAEGQSPVNDGMLPHHVGYSEGLLSAEEIHTRTATPTNEPRLLTMERCEVAGRSGECVVMETCDPYVRLIRHQLRRPVPALARFLEDAHCSSDGTITKVCCPILDFLPTTLESTKSSSFLQGQKAPRLGEKDFVDHLPEPPVCGFSNASISRGVGSNNAKLGEFPWMALLGYKNGPMTSWNCGGSLITSKHVLTAARCIHNHEETLYVVRLGELDLTREDDGATPVDILIRKMVYHELYDRTTVTNDIGFLVLQKEVQFTGLIHPICLPQSTELRINKFERYNPTIAGWGNFENIGPAASWQQAAQLPVISIEACQNAYKNHTKQLIDERVICADGHSNGSKDACTGDTGGPLMLPILYSKTGKMYFHQLGVTSVSKMCGEPAFPAVYTRVTAFVPWLQEKLTGKTPIEV